MEINVNLYRKAHHNKNSMIKIFLIPEPLQNDVLYID